MAADGAVATLSTGPDVPVLVDEVVVANVAPATRDRVVVVDGADRGGDVRPAVVGHGVVDDELLDLLIARRPLHERLVGRPVLAREDARRSHRRGVGVRVGEVGERAGDVLEQSHDRTLLQIAHVHEREVHARDRVGVAVRQPYPVLGVARAVDRHGRGEVLIGVLVGHVLFFVRAAPVRPARSVGRGPDLDEERVLGAARRDPVDAEAVEGLTWVEDVRGQKERLAAGRARVRALDLGAARGGQGARPACGIRLRQLVGDDLARGARGRDRGSAEVGEEGEDERADKKEEAQARAASVQPDPLLPLPPTPTPNPDSDIRGAGLSCFRNEWRGSVVTVSGRNSGADASHTDASEAALTGRGSRWIRGVVRRRWAIVRTWADYSKAGIRSC